MNRDEGRERIAYTELDEAIPQEEPPDITKRPLGSLRTWFVGLDTRARMITVLAGIGIPLCVGIIGTVGPRTKTGRTNTGLNTNVSKPSTLATASPTAVPIPYPSQDPPNPKFTQKVDRCLGIEGELAGIKLDQGRVEQLLDETQDFSDEGTLKKGLHLNALKRKAELQLQRIALERKLKACRK